MTRADTLQLDGATFRKIGHRYALNAISLDHPGSPFAMYLTVWDRVADDTKVAATVDIVERGPGGRPLYVLRVDRREPTGHGAALSAYRAARMSYAQRMGSNAKYLADLDKGAA